MCMMVYIAASQPLDLVVWNEALPAFHVSDLHETEVSVKAQFRSAYVYYAGSHEGCGGGCRYGEYPKFVDDERNLKRASLDAFAAYLVRQLARVETIELYACWDGDQAAPPEHRRALTPSNLYSESFYFLEK